jgi:hypothetical protein
VIESAEHGVGFWAGVAVGVPIIVWGIWLFVESTPAAGPRVELALFVVGLVLVHDALLAPAACVIGALVARVAPSWLRPPLQAGLLASAFVLAVAWLPLQGTAEPVGNASIQPLDYATATATVLAVVWLGASIWAVVRWRS